MHPLFGKASNLTETFVAASIEVHSAKGPGSVEAVYEWCLARELKLRNLDSVSQPHFTLEYKGFTQEVSVQFGVLVEGCVLIKAKAVEKVLPGHKTQLLHHMKLLDVPLGLLINFQELEVTKGISRLILPGADR